MIELLHKLSAVVTNMGQEGPFPSSSEQGRNDSGLIEVFYFWTLEQPRLLIFDFRESAESNVIFTYLPQEEVIQVETAQKLSEEIRQRGVPSNEILVQFATFVKKKLREFRPEFADDRRHIDFKLHAVNRPDRLFGSTDWQDFVANHISEERDRVVLNLVTNNVLSAFNNEMPNMSATELWQRRN